MLPPTKAEASAEASTDEGACVLPPTASTDKGACVLPPTASTDEGACVLPPTDEGAKEKPVHRRIDIRLVPIDQYFVGILYFTGKHVW